MGRQMTVSHHISVLHHTLQSVFRTPNPLSDVDGVVTCHWLLGNWANGTKNMIGCGMIYIMCVRARERERGRAREATTRSAARMLSIIGGWMLLYNEVWPPCCPHHLMPGHPANVRRVDLNKTFRISNGALSLMM